MEEKKNPVQSAERIFLVMEALADAGEIGLMELSNKLGLHKSTVHRLLTSLICMGYARQDEETGKYMLSFKIVGLSGKVLDRMEILPIARPYMRQLSDISQETVHLVRRAGNEIVYIDKVESKVGSIRMVSQIGMVHSMYCSGVGKAILAHLTKDEVKAIWEVSNIQKKTEHTIVRLEELYKELEEIRQKGYAMDNEENEEGVRCIAASILDYGGKAKYAFSISAPVNRMTEERVQELAEDVLRVKKELSFELGYRG